MFKKISFIVLALLLQSQCAASFGKKPNSAELQRVVMPLAEHGLTEHDLNDEIDILIPGEEEENPSCWQCVGPCIISSCAAFFYGWIDQQYNKIK